MSSQIEVVKDTAGGTHLTAERASAAGVPVIERPSTLTINRLNAGAVIGVAA